MSAAFATTTTVNEVSNSMTQTVNKLADLAYSNSQYVISESILDYHVLGINTPDRKLNTITLAKKLCVEYIPSPKFYKLTVYNKYKGISNTLYELPSDIKTNTVVNIKTRMLIHAFMTDASYTNMNEILGECTQVTLYSLNDRYKVIYRCNNEQHILPTWTVSLVLNSIYNFYSTHMTNLTPEYLLQVFNTAYITEHREHTQLVSSNDIYDTRSVKMEFTFEGLEDDKRKLFLHTILNRYAINKKYNIESRPITFQELNESGIDEEYFHEVMRHVQMIAYNSGAIVGVYRIKYYEPIGICSICNLNHI